MSEKTEDQLMRDIASQVAIWDAPDISTLTGKGQSWVSRNALRLKGRKPMSSRRWRFVPAVTWPILVAEGFVVVVRPLTLTKESRSA